MHSDSEGGRVSSTYLQDGGCTIGTSWGEELVVVFFTICKATPLIEGLGANLLSTVCAGEMLRVPGLSQSSDYLYGDKDKEDFVRGISATKMPLYAQCT